jgi:hypothetical protein
MAVKFDKPIGNSIDYNGEKYKHPKYEIVYAYQLIK